MLFLSVAVKRFQYSSAMIMSMQNCSPGAQKQFHGKDWIPPFLYKIPRFPFRKKSKNLLSFKANVLLKGHFSFLQGRKGMKRFPLHGSQSILHHSSLHCYSPPRVRTLQLPWIWAVTEQILKSKSPKRPIQKQRVLTTKKKATCNS